MRKLLVNYLSVLLFLVLALTSCSVPQYLSGPELKYPTIDNKCSFGIQNMDENAKIENEKLTCHYNGFDIKYDILYDYKTTLTIVNSSNKSMIIDKSKCFVLYDGYSTQLFKDVRSSRSTTFNNVQDAINNVQTNEASVTMTIPPYSKWELPLNETNIRQIRKLPPFNTDYGVHPLTPYDNPETVEFVIPYSFDYSMAKWSTSRNRIYVNSIEVPKGEFPHYIQSEIRHWDENSNQYIVRRSIGEPDYTEANRIDRLNRAIYKKHKSQVITGNLIATPFTLGVSLLYVLFGGCINVSHQPPTYGNGQ